MGMEIEEVKKVIDKLQFYMDNFDYDNFDNDGFDIFYQSWSNGDVEMDVADLIDPVWFKPEELRDYHIEFLLDSLKWIEEEHLDKILPPKAWHDQAFGLAKNEINITLRTHIKDHGKLEENLEKSYKDGILDCLAIIEKWTSVGIMHVPILYIREPMERLLNPPQNSDQLDLIELANEN